MNCDQVFDALTRGPFPSGDASDASVERHLLACHECRQLAEALRPAVALFHESVPAHELDDLPGYQGALCEPFADQGVRTAVSLASPPLRDRRRPAWRRLERLAMSQFAAGAILTIAIVALFWSRFGPAPDRGGWAERGAPAHDRHPVAGSTLSKQIALSLGRFSMSNNCFPDGPWADDFGRGRGLTSRQCCTSCHTAAAPPTIQSAAFAATSAPLADRINAIARTCGICHFFDTAN
ncbi:MAG: hypothetical protein FJ295_20580 [Planctomycetes bacterium]|nr:hypothetical protein [Planctomycetota bacterium]